MGVGHAGDTSGLPGPASASAQGGGWRKWPVGSSSALKFSPPHTKSRRERLAQASLGAGQVFLRAPHTQIPSSGHRLLYTHPQTLRLSEGTFAHGRRRRPCAGQAFTLGNLEGSGPRDLTGPPVSPPGPQGCGPSRRGPITSTCAGGPWVAAGAPQKRAEQDGGPHGQTCLCERRPPCSPGVGAREGRRVSRMSCSGPCRQGT